MDTTPQGSQPVDKVSWGPTSYLGYGTAGTAFVLALIAFLSGDRDEQTLGVIVSGVIGGLAFAVTSIGRYLQAREKIKVSSPERQQLLDALQAALSALNEKGQAPVTVNAAETIQTTQEPPQPPERVEGEIGKLEWSGAPDAAPDRGVVNGGRDVVDEDASALADIDGEADPDRVSGAPLEEV